LGIKQILCWYILGHKVPEKDSEKVDFSNPLIFTFCIRCGRAVRIEQDVRDSDGYFVSEV